MQLKMHISPSLLLLLLTNVAVGVMAVTQGWEAYVVLWTYWAQSLIIGGFNMLRMFLLNSRDPYASKDLWKRYEMVLFFMVHFGFFHFIYGIFLLDGGGVGVLTPEGGLWEVAMGVGLFLLNHSFSFFINVRQDLKSEPSEGLLLFIPYIRIIPMHLAIILSAALPILIPFLILKVLADGLMHEVEHRMLRES